MAPKGEAKTFSNPYCWVEGCTATPVKETRLDSDGKIGVCTDHKLIWENLVKFLSKYPHLATSPSGESLISATQKKQIVNILADPGSRLTYQAAYNAVMHPEPVVHDIPRNMTIASNVIALVQTFGPPIASMEGVPPISLPITRCFYRRLSWSDREVSPFTRLPTRTPTGNSDLRNYEVQVKCLSKGGVLVQKWISPYLGPPRDGEYLTPPEILPMKGDVLAVRALLEKEFPLYTEYGRDGVDYDWVLRRFRQELDQGYYDDAHDPKDDEEDHWRWNGASRVKFSNEDLENPGNLLSVTSPLYVSKADQTWLMKCDGCQTTLTEKHEICPTCEACPTWNTKLPVGAFFKDGRLYKTTPTVWKKGGPRTRRIPSHFVSPGPR